MQVQASPMDTLLEYQKTHVESIINSLISYNRALDTSDTGTGKTFTSVCTCKTIGWKPFIVCPKSVIASWMKVLEIFKCEFYGIVNYDSTIGTNVLKVEAYDEDSSTFGLIKFKLVDDERGGGGEVR